MSTDVSAKPEPAIRLFIDGLSNDRDLGRLTDSLKGLNDEQVRELEVQAANGLQRTKRNHAKWLILQGAYLYAMSVASQSPRRFTTFYKKLSFTKTDVYTSINAFLAFQGCSNLELFAPTALRMLAAPTIDQSVRDEAISMAESNDRVTVEIAKKLISEAREKNHPRHSKKTSPLLGPDILGHLSVLNTQGFSARCVYADPPWRYDNTASRGAAENHYSTMSIDDLAELPVNKVVADNAHLHLWTTVSFIREAIDLMEPWGFSYRGQRVWVKPTDGNGNYWRGAHEICLLGVRGSLRFENKSLGSWFPADRGPHSQKPTDMRDAIELVSPGPYLELFARGKPAPGWTAIGNEVSDPTQD